MVVLMLGGCALTEQNNAANPPGTQTNQASDASETDDPTRPVIDVAQAASGGIRD